MKRLVPFFVAVGLIIMILLGVAGVQVVKKYMPTKEQADLNALYETDENHTAVFFNYELQAPFPPAPNPSQHQSLFQ